MPDIHTPGRWQRPDGWPTDEYFDAVATECKARGVEFERWYRNEDWEADFELDTEYLERHAIGRVWPGVILRWWVSEDSEPLAGEFISRAPAGETGTAWFWVGVDPDNDRSAAAWFANLDNFAEPAEVAAAIVDVIA